MNTKAPKKAAYQVDSLQATEFMGEHRLGELGQDAPSLGQGQSLKLSDGRACFASGFWFMATFQARNCDVAQRVSTWWAGFVEATVEATIVSTTFFWLTEKLDQGLLCEQEAMTHLWLALTRKSTHDMT